MSEKKRNRYKRIQAQIANLFIKNENLLSKMATINAILYQKMDNFFWVGFYLLKNDRLLVGPYQGPLACLELPKNKGVCWEGINRGTVIVVPDIHEFPDHITCDSRSKSEIVIPLKNSRNEIIGVLDIDSKLKGNFDDIDAVKLQTILKFLEK